MTLDAGDPAFGGSDTSHYKMPSDGSGSQGDLVKISSGQVTPTTTNGDAIFAILKEDAPSTAGDEVGVVLHGPVAVTADGSVTAGDLLQPSGSTNGHAVSADAAEGIVTSVDEGGTATYEIYSRTLVALEDGSDGDVIKCHFS